MIDEWKDGEGDGSLDVEVRLFPGRLSERMARTSLWDENDNN